MNSLITPAIRKQINKLGEGYFNANSYAESVQEIEQQVKELQAEQQQIEEHIAWVIYRLGSFPEAVGLLLVKRVKDIEQEIADLNQDKEKYFKWVKKHIEKGAKKC